MNLWWTVRSKTGIAAMSLGVLAVAGLAAGVPALTATPASSQTSEGAYVVPADTPAATTPLAAPAPEPAVAAQTTPAPVAQPVAEAPAATVNTVTEPAPAPQPQPADGVGTTGVDGYYTPAPQRQLPGEPAESTDSGGSTGPMGGGGTPLPGEPGYTGNAVVPQIPIR